LPIEYYYNKIINATTTKIPNLGHLAFRHRYNIQYKWYTRKNSYYRILFTRL